MNYNTYVARAIPVQRTQLL
jgi:hypothetical protein